jgi:hypothetical protein
MSKIVIVILICYRHKPIDLITGSGFENKSAPRRNRLVRKLIRWHGERPLLPH